MTTHPVEAWDVQEALRLAAGITERHGATPYGFRFTTRSRGSDDLDSEVSATSPMHYFGCKIETLDEIKARNDPRDRILISNMERNDWDRVATTTSGWKWTQPISADDIVLEAA
jgi:hypothetical protein